MDFMEDFLPPVEMSDVPPHLVQIKASDDEIRQRIESFMKLKREEINAANIREFCRIDSNSEPSGCARINSVLQKRNDSIGHLQVSRVLNTYRKDTMSLAVRKCIPPNGIEERLQNVETQLNMHTPVPKDVYKRLKTVEDRLLRLESISPEYSNFWDKTSAIPFRAPKKQVFSVEDVDNLIKELESKRG